ncbi:MAG: C25 family cysteine peptidase [Candidatus Fermentibacter sp.]|nr:C25 family cysteine peptidase [Candidatus Fermentibacter sp.]
MILLLLATALALPEGQAGVLSDVRSGSAGFSATVEVPGPSFRSDGDVYYPVIPGFSSWAVEGGLVRPCIVFYVPLPPGASPELAFTVEDRREAPPAPRGRPAVSPHLEGTGLSTVTVYDDRASAPPPAVVEMSVVRAMGVDLAQVRISPFDGEGYGDYAGSVGISLEWGGAPGSEPLSDGPLSLICPGGVVWWPHRAQRTAASPFWGMPWARIETSVGGCHVLTGAMLDSAGVDILGADSQTLRMLTGPGLMFDLEWRDETHAASETSILVLDGGDGSFDAADSILFVGRALWRFEPSPESTPPLGRLSHRYDTRNVYWLTWGGEPGRMMESVPSSPDGSPAWPGDLLAPLFVEQEAFWLPGHEIETGWVWTELSTSYDSYFPFMAERVGEPADILLSFVPDENVTGQLRITLNGDSVGGCSFSGYPPPFTVLLEDVGIAEGSNTIITHLTLTGGSGSIYFDNMTVSYPRLPADAGGADLLPSGAPDGRYTLSLGLEGDGPARVFDCSRHYAVDLLDGASDQGGTVSLSLDIGQESRLLAVRPGDLRTPSSISPAEPGRIVGTLDGADAVIIAADILAEASAPLEALMEAGGLQAELVTLGEVYDEFGQGVADPGAVRSFISWALDTWDPAPSDFIFVGDGHYDVLNRNSPEPCLFPPWLKLGNSDQLFDDFYVMTTPGQFLPEASLSRIPADSPQDVSVFVAKAAAYRSGDAAGAWSDRILLTADDEWGNGTPSETWHTYTCELLADSCISPMYDRGKFYLIEYPWPESGTHPFKPEAQEDYVEALSEGWLAVLFFGHGSHDQICHEKLLVNSDIARIDNGPRQPVMVFASCDVGSFELVSADCMSEEFVLNPGAGAIATIGATRGTNANEPLFEDFCSMLFDGTSATGTGQALWASKLLNPFQNSYYYVLFGDGTMRPMRPASGTQVALGGDAILRGRVNPLEASYPSDCLARVRVTESAAWTEYTCLGGNLIEYLKYGSTAFSGSFLTSGGLLDLDFFMPLQSDTGAYGRAAALGMSDAGGVSDWLEWVPVADSGGYAADSTGPLIEQSLEGCAGESPVTGPDPVFQADLSDPSGICTFGGGAGRSILINLDSQAFDLSAFFAYDQGSSTAGSLEYQLPHLLEGPHRIIMAAWDGMGNFSRDTLDFQVVEDTGVSLDEFLVYPNPSAGPVCFSFRASTDGSAKVSIYTIAGRRIREISSDLSAGYCQVLWDGLDADGDEPASGAYLFVLGFEGDGGSVTERGVIALARDG